ncbi:hypothetical protein HKCCSP123_05260 [Rhodobacterales bacterium HKCCSP123]|nr:hypothetical protein [Rhodobacterales bacterium HKCCSP123]
MVARPSVRSSWRIGAKPVFSFIAGLVALVMATSSAMAQPIATAVQVDGAATITLNGRSGALRSGVRVEQGSTIATGGSGVVQLTFDDATNMVIGPNSQLEITAVLMGGGNRASRFAVNAVAGGFRFISGNSARDAYEITTPTATMGIRGTEFDIAVARRSTALALFSGGVQMCRSRGNCALVQGSCAIARTEGSRISGVGGAEAAELLEAAFPLVRGQRALRPNFRVSSGGCDQYTRQIRSEAPAPTPQGAPQPQPQPQPQQQPQPQPEPQPEEASFGHGDASDGYAENNPGNGVGGPGQGGPGRDQGGNNGNGNGNGNGNRNGN